MYLQNVKYFMSINKMPLDGKLPNGDSRWFKFTNSFENCELTQEQILTAIIDGHAYCSWLNGGRKKENFTLAQHIALDFDTEDSRSEISTLVSNPMIRAYASIIHTTSSHKDSAPRARAIFLLDNPVIELTKYETMLQFMINMFQADSSCSDATHFYYGAKDCGAVLLGHELPISHLRELYRRYDDKAQKRPVVEQPQNGVAVDWPAPRHFKTGDASKNEIASALSVLPRHFGPNSYDTWLSILMAVHSEMGSDGIGLCEQFIPGHQGEVERKFKGFKEDKGVGIGTLFHIAKEYGYQQVERLA